MLVMPDLGLLVTASMDARMHVWDLGVHTLRRTLNAGHNKGVYRLAYVASQRYLISAGFDHYCKVWNPMIEEPLFTMSGHTNVIAGMEVRGPHNQLAGTRSSALKRSLEMTGKRSSALKRSLEMRHQHTKRQTTFTRHQTVDTCET